MLKNWLQKAYIHVLKLQPGDVIVYCYPTRLSSNTVDNIKQRLGDRFPGHMIVVLDGGASLEVLRNVESNRGDERVTRSL